MYKKLHLSDCVLHMDTYRVVAPDGSGWSDYQSWLAAGNMPLDADTPDQIKLDYRQKRAAAYVTALSPEGHFASSVGDLFDAQLKAIYAMRQAVDALGVDVSAGFVELDDLAAKIAKIKARHPKP